MHPQPVAIPAEQLDSVATLVQEHEQAALEDVLVKLVADDGDQPIVRLAEVDGFAAEINRRLRIEA